MRRDIFEPFNRDIEIHGTYEYAQQGFLGSLVANERLTQMTADVTDYVGKRVVEIGCGDGQFTRDLRDRTDAASILGVDLAERAIESATRKYVPGTSGLAFRHASAQDLLREGRHFDVAIYRNVIHHVGSPPREIAVGLRLADLVLFLDPNGLCPMVKILEKTCKYHVEHEDTSYRLSDFERWITGGGGKIVWSAHFGMVPFFCSNWFVPIALFCEGITERIPLLRRVVCGRLAVLAKGVPRTSG